MTTNTKRAIFTVAVVVIAMLGTIAFAAWHNAQSGVIETEAFGQPASAYEDTAHASGDRGAPVLGVRNDAATALAADGDYMPLTMDGSGRLWAAAWLTATTDGTYIGDIKFGESLPTGSNTIGDVTVSDITTGTVAVDDGGNILSVDDAGGSLTVDDGATSLTVDGSVVVSSVTTGTVQVDDGGNVLSVDDAGGSLTVDDGATSLTVDGTVAVSDVTTGTIDVGAVSGTVTVDSELPAAAALADAASNPTVPKVGAAQLLYNATAVNANWDRERNNWAEWPFPSLQRTASSWVQLVNYNARGAYIVVNITGIGLDQSLTVSAQLYDYDGAGSEASDQQETIWASAALTPTGRHSYLIYPGAGAAAQDVVATVSYPLPRLWNVSATLNNSEPITFSIGVHYIN